MSLPATDSGDSRPGLAYDGAVTRRETNLTDGPLAVAALRAVAGQPGGAWWAWAVLLAAGTALDLGARAAGVDVDGTRVDAGFWAWQGIEALLTAAASGWALAFLLTGAAPRARGLAAFVLLLAAVELYWDGAAQVFPVGDEAGALEVTLRFVALVAVMGGGVFVFSRLMLWPIGLLIGGDGPSPAGSWARMESQTWPYFGAAILLTFPIFLESFLLFSAPVGDLGAEGTTPTLIKSRVEATVETALTTALSAAMWRRRQGATSERLSDVFA